MVKKYIGKFESYSYDELSEEAKQKALEEYYDVNVDYEWWEFDEEDFVSDMKSKGITFGDKSKIYFSLDRDNYAYASNVYVDSGNSKLHKALGLSKKISDALNDGILELSVGTNTYAMGVGANYGDVSDYRQDEDLKHMRITDKDIDELQLKFDAFVKGSFQNYKSTLQKSYDYLTSKEAIEETIKANEYEFSKDGKYFRTGHAMEVNEVAHFNKGGIVRQTGPAVVHKGELILPKETARAIAKASKQYSNNQGQGGYFRHPREHSINAIKGKRRKFGTFEFGGEQYLTNPKTGDILLTKKQYKKYRR